MRLRILSDLHLEAGPWTWRPAGEDLLILAGDVADASPAGIGRRRELWKAIAQAGMPTLYVLGNHEGYADWIPQDLLRDRIQAELPPEVRILDRDAVDLGGIRFLGCSLWTDFSLLKGIHRRGVPVTRDLAMHAAGVGIADFIYLCRPRLGQELPQRITPEDMAAWHRTDRAWLDHQIQQADRPVVVITHFLPSPASIDAHYQGSLLNPYFATDCRDLIRSPVQMWIHGHTHASCDYLAGGVRVVCNPRGYVGRTGVPNPTFDSTWIIELTSPGGQVDPSSDGHLSD
ncbi:MAG: metallophosphoesterase [Planctomycetes bacterium]|nr:metallophosphoesterase [Planctomycetota bacterium]